MKKAEEVFMIVQGLSHKTLGRFTWRTWFRACDAVLRPNKYQTQAGFKMTVGNMLRAQVKHGTIRRHARGVYEFTPAVDLFGHSWDRQRPRSPLYVSPDKFRMTERRLPPGVRALSLEEKRAVLRRIG